MTCVFSLFITEKLNVNTLNKNGPVLSFIKIKNERIKPTMIYIYMYHLRKINTNKYFILLQSSSGNFEHNHLVTTTNLSNKQSFNQRTVHTKP